MRCFEPRTEIMSAAQREIWPQLRVVAESAFVLYGGTAVALCLGHRNSDDFDFFRSEPLEKDALRNRISFLPGASVQQDAVDTLSVSVPTRSGAVKVSFFGGIGFGRVGDPMQTADGMLLVASLNDLLATKLKSILDRAELRDYQDIAAMLRHGMSLQEGLGAFRALFGGEPAAVLLALGWFRDGNLPMLAQTDRDTLLAGCDSVDDVPALPRKARTLALPLGECDEFVSMRGLPGSSG
jgi:hypothetical protein